RRLLDALGVEPGPALRGRMAAILNHAPDLAAPEQPRYAARSATLTDVLDLGGEIARMQRRMDELRREQEALVRRFERLAAQLPTTAAASPDPAA
ncbi:hypothetical protein P8605_49925, partial [Streptomyces sp. T-3]|nr:hypothetical protein [Streptomyces sp. T-3]